MTKAILTHPSWHQIEKGCAIIANKVLRDLRDGTTPDWILGVARGGLIPAVMISHMLDVPMLTTCYSSKKGAGDDRNHDNLLPEIPEQRKVSTILIVDDIIDTGNTIQEIYNHYRLKNLNHIIVHAALYHKVGSSIIPNYTWQTIPENAPWIEFPWEV